MTQFTRYFAGAFHAALVTTPALAAQVTVIDEGSFTISRNGEAVGREEFRIARTPGTGGDIVVAQATVSYGGAQRLSPALQTDAAGAPLKYVVEVKMGPETQEKLSGTVGRGRFSARIQTPRGESAREFIVADGALVLDDDIFHQYYFLAQGARSGPVAVVVPRRNVQLAMNVTERGSDAVTIGGRRLEARTLVVSEHGGGERLIWVDAQGRVLKVSIPARGLVALRDDPPR
jgi:hypothetical protein